MSKLTAHGYLESYYKIFFLIKANAIIFFKQIRHKSNT
jgi:hypothetical protein